MKARPISEYHEDMGPVLWWRFPIDEPPYVGSPLDLGFPIEMTIDWQGGVPLKTRVHVGGWPGYHTHFTPLPEAPTE